ncbi:MAG: glutaredoxin [Oscillospiraceae bacterium]
MKELTMFYFKGCPFCQQALRWHEEIFEEHPEYRQVSLKMIDEKKEPSVAAEYDYYYVPTYYIGREKLYEGVKEKALIEECFRRAYNG